MKRRNVCVRQPAVQFIVIKCSTFFSPLFSNQIIGNQGKEKNCQKTSINGINRNYSEHVKSIEAKKTASKSVGNTITKTSSECTNECD